MTAEDLIRDNHDTYLQACNFLRQFIHTSVIDMDGEEGKMLVEVMNLLDELYVLTDLPDEEELENDA